MMTRFRCHLISLSVNCATQDPLDIRRNPEGEEEEEEEGERNE